MATESQYEPKWNPRYVQYARVHGHNPESMLLADRARCNGSSMMYFIFWIGDKWLEFDKIYPQYKCGGDHTNEGHKIFDAWLTTLPVLILPKAILFTTEYVDVRQE